MSYGRSMKDWEARDDERREQIWLDDLERAIEAHDKTRVTELMKLGLINVYDFPDFPAGSWARDELERLKRAGY